MQRAVNRQPGNRARDCWVGVLEVETELSENASSRDLFTLKMIPVVRKNLDDEIKIFDFLDIHENPTPARIFTSLENCEQSSNDIFRASEVYFKI